MLAQNKDKCRYGYISSCDGPRDVNKSHMSILCVTAGRLSFYSTDKLYLNCIVLFFCSEIICWTNNFIWVLTSSSCLRISQRVRGTSPT